jgi:ABC-2 type transport system permease protein
MSDNDSQLSLDYILDDEPAPIPVKRAPVVTETVYRAAAPVSQVAVAPRPVAPLAPVAAPAVVTNAAAALPEYSSPFSGQKVSFWRMIRSEWIKFWTLRSTWWVVIMTIALMAGFAALFAYLLRTGINQGGMGGGMGPGGGGGMGSGILTMLSGVNIVTVGLQFAQLTVAVLGVLMITNEYSSGMIRATFQAAPHRGRVLLAKLVVLLTTTALIAGAGLALAWLASSPILADIEGFTQVNLNDGTHLRALIGAVLFLLAIAMFSLGIGALLRATAGGIFTVVAVLMVLPMIFQIILVASNANWAININKYLPSVAGEQIYTTGGLAQAMSAMEVLGPWPGFFVLLGYALLAFLAAFFMLRNRDA